MKKTLLKKHYETYLRFLLLFLCLITMNSCIKNLTDEELIETYQESVSNNKWEKALTCVDEGIKRNPNNTSLYFSKAFCLKNISPIENHREILESINIFIEKNKTSSLGRLLKYTNLYENRKYKEALEEVGQIEKYYGVSVNTLLMKANAMFLNKDYKNASFQYEEASMYPHPKEKFKTIYYYKIYSKYFSGNKEGAMWDTAFLNHHGLKEDKTLMELISNNQLDINDYNKIEFYNEADEFEEQIKINLEYDRLFNPIYSKRLFYEANNKVDDLKRLDPNIELLNLSYSNAIELPDDIKKFKRLKGINLSKNKIKDFDKLFRQLSELPNLEYLELDYSNLKKFPSSISKLKNLKGLSLEASNIHQLPKEIGRLRNLGYLSIRNNSKIRDLPEEIKYLKKLNCLDVSGSGIRRLREEIGSCYNLVSIKSNASKVESIPNSIGNLKNMRLLNLGFNNISKIPESIGDITYLENFNIGSNSIEELPSSIEKLQNLNMLSMQFNRFKKFPKEILGLENIQTLWLHNNSIPSIPADIGNLKKLTHLLIDHEIITDNNIDQIKERNPNIYVIREDSRRYVGGIKRKK